MAIELEKRFAPANVRKRVSRICLWAFLVSFFLLALATGTPVEMGSSKVSAIIISCLNLITLTVFFASLSDLDNLSSGLAERLREMHKTAQQLENGDVLFTKFRPSQSLVDQALTDLALVMDAKCKDQAEFYANSREILADRVVPGTVRGDDQELEKLRSCEATLSEAVKSAKDNFWDLHARVKLAKFEVRPRWMDYLPRK